MFGEIIAAIAAVASIAVVYFLAYWGGKRYGRMENERDNATKAVEGHEQAEKSNAKPLLDSDALRDWFDRLRK